MITFKNVYLLRTIAWLIILVGYAGPIFFDTPSRLVWDYIFVRNTFDYGVVGLSYYFV